MATGFRQCQAHNKRTNKRCMNPAFTDFVGVQPSFCARHIEQEIDSPYGRCGVVFKKGENEQLCPEVVLKRFGVCARHFETYLDSVPEVNRIEQLNETLSFLTEQSATLLTQMQQYTKTNKDIYHQKYRTVRKLQVMRTKTLEKIRSFTSSQDNSPSVSTSEETLPLSLSPELVGTLSGSESHTTEESERTLIERKRSLLGSPNLEGLPPEASTLLIPDEELERILDEEEKLNNELIQNDEG